MSSKDSTIYIYIVEESDCVALTLPIIALVTTSGKRTKSLIGKALPSVLRQTRLPDAVIVVDDNQDEKEFDTIRQEIEQRVQRVHILLYRNRRTKGFSGTGAWNTGFECARAYLQSCEQKDGYIAILDDDDEWLPNHLELCSGEIGDEPLGVFCRLTRVYEKYQDEGKLKDIGLLTIDNFLIGNPGVQGSNMFFRLSVLESIGGFDERLRSCTDRDLLIRLLEKYGNEQLKVVPHNTVLHDARSPFCVTNNIEDKTAGLDTFYRKHLWRFDEQTLENSIIRAENLFSYPNKQQIWENYYQRQEIIAIMMPLHNGARSVRKSVRSVVTQERTKRPIVLFIGDDASTDNWRDEISDWLRHHHNIITVDINGGSPAKARNALAEYILQAYPRTYILCRLDADDELCSVTTISEIEHLFAHDKVKAVLCGNYQMQEGCIVGVNRASADFYNSEYMSRRLLAMAQGDFAAELPSCNLCFRPSVYKPYPDECSGEDHWLVIQTLLYLPKREFLMASQQMYCVYNLDGKATQLNKASDGYIDSRKRLYEYYINSIDG